MEERLYVIRIAYAWGDAPSGRETYTAWVRTYSRDMARMRAMDRFNEWAGDRPTIGVCFTGTFTGELVDGWLELTPAYS